MLSAAELVRYQRHLGLAGFGPEAQTKLKASSVLVVGVGGLGCPALLYLAAAGVGRLVVIDPDRVELSNLQRQLLFATEDIGQPKAKTAAHRLRALNPEIVIEAIVARFDRANALALVGAADVVVDGSDNFATRYLVNDACVLAGRPFVHAAIQGFEGQASVFNWRGGPTYRCLFPAPPPPGAGPSCSEAGVLGVLPGMLGTLQATETIKLLAGIGEPLSGRVLLWDAWSLSIRIIALTADPRSRMITELPPDPVGEVCPADSGKPLDLREELDADALRARLSDLQLIDVRETPERASGAIGASVHVPLDRLATVDLLALGLEPSRPTVVYCSGGVRSRRAVQALREKQGFTDVRGLHGGYQAWMARLAAD
jgi:adenylyltransferase/sulfurtransferase